MKKFLLTFCLFICGCTQVDIYESYRFEGISAFAVSQSDNKVIVKCNCNGTKIIRPDGKIEQPCPCGSNCQCKKEDNVAPDTPKKRTITLKYFGTENCGFCRQTVDHVFPALKKKGWIIEDEKSGKDAHIFISKSESFDAYPVWIRYEDGKEVDRHVGFLNANGISRFYSGLKVRGSDRE